MIISSILTTLFIGTTFILDRGENDYFPLVRLVKQLFLGFACINYNFAKKNKRLLESL